MGIFGPKQRSLTQQLELLFTKDSFSGFSPVCMVVTSPRVKLSYTDFSSSMSYSSEIESQPDQQIVPLQLLPLRIGYCHLAVLGGKIYSGGGGRGFGFRTTIPYKKENKHMMEGISSNLLPHPKK
jgi:hypothetical protein